MDNLVFKNCVLKEFDFLVSEYGFSCTHSDPYYLRFESDSVFVELYYDGRRSFEMDVAIGLLGDLYEGKERPFYLGEIIRFASRNDDEAYQLMQASTADKVARLVPTLAILTKKYAKEFLLGDKFHFKALSDFREKESNECVLEETLRHVRAAVKKAWGERDYISVIRLYEPVKNHLTPSEQKKLEYCYSHLEG